ncbi:MAG: DNA cytosine methyltransferase [Roseburia sp.]|nr:DNA cytosine methyltransferase [Roseburia sp.]
MKNLRILGVSAGQGALLYPFKDQLVANVELRGVFHTKGEEQWKLNFGDVPFLKSLEPVLNEHVDIIIGSPDCGASSVMRLSKVKQLGNPKENKSLNLLLQAVQHFQPKIFLIENLPRLISLLPQSYFEEALPDYKIVYHHCSVAEYGNSQTSRKRLVIIGIQKKAKNFLKAFDKVFSIDDCKVTSDLLEAAYYKLNNKNYMPPLEKTLAMYDYRKLPQKKNLTVKQIHHLWKKDFVNEKKWPIKTAKMSTLPGVYRLEKDKAPLTLRPADRQFRPDGWPLGIQDFKNIMGFPKSYQVYMDKDEYLYWLNKARYTLAKGSVYQVGLWFKKCLKRALKGGKSE